MKPINEKPVILFDGVCNLCNGAVQFVIRRDSPPRFLFASLQSPYAREVMTLFGLDPAKLHSVLLLQDGKLYQRSEAALRIAIQLKGLSWSKIFLIIPRFLRDTVYDLIARSRYAVSGKRDSCMIPTPELKERFITG